MDPIDVDPTLIDWTPAGLKYLRCMPITAGDDYEIRYQFMDDDGEALSLAGATVTMTINGTTPFLRVSGVEVTGLAGVLQLEIDADQATEDTVNFTGKGWVTIRFTRATSDRAALVALGSTDRGFDLLAVWADDSRRTQAFGKIAFRIGFAA